MKTGATTATLCVALTLALLVVGSEASIYINPKTLNFVDNHGRTLLFHGVNVV